MTSSLLQLPPEILIPTLALLPNQTILKFSQCSRYARSLANSSLHTLDIVFQSPSLRKDFDLISHRSLIRGSSVRRRYCTRECLGGRHVHPCQLIHQRQGTLSSNEEVESGKSIIRVPDAEIYEYATLVNFHSALLSSILGRHRNALRNLDISIWALTVPISKAISNIHALRELSITIQDRFQERGSQRKFLAEQAAAWDVLCSSATSAGRLNILHLENGDLTHRQLFRLLTKNPRCQELTLLKCGAIGKELWDFLGGEWQGRSSLRALTVAHCGGTLGKTTLHDIGKLKGLEVRTRPKLTGKWLINEHSS